MPIQRDNLVLIAALAAALALHAVTLPWVGAAVGQAHQDPRINLRLDSFETQASAAAGQTLSLAYAFSVDHESDDLTADVQTRVLLSRDRLADDADVVLLRTTDRCVFDSEREQEKRSPERPLPKDADGPYWLIADISFTENVKDSDPSDNARVVPIYIDGPQRPELAIESFVTPRRATAGGSILVDLGVQNVGDGWASSNPRLGEHGWADRIYLSTDDRLDPTDLPLRTIERTAPLGPDGEYRHEQIELDLPRSVTGPMHLILAADADQVLDQPSFTRGFAIRSIRFVDTNRPDLIVSSIRSPARFVLTRPAPIALSVVNLGSVSTLTSNWVDGVYLSDDDRLDSDDLLLTTIDADRPLAPRSRYESLAELTLPESVEPGRRFLIVKADSANAVDEAVFEDNNALAIPIEVLTPEQADAEIKLGDPDRPERLVVQWIENDRLEEHIARRSRTVQPALQSQADPDPDAPLVDNPQPPTLAATDAATGDPNRQAQRTDPVTPDTDPLPPDAAATDTAPRPQTESSPNQSRLDGLAGDRGTINPNRPGADTPPTPDRPLDPTPSTQTTPTPTPGERDVPTPADPTAPDTDAATDSDTPAEIESDTDSKNPDETDTTQPSDNQTTDPLTTPNPDTQDAAKPEGDDGDPATPSEEQTPTRAPRDESEAPPTDIKITELELQEGRVLVGKGIKVTTKRPTPPGTGSRVLSIPRNARVSITFDNKGNVFKAEVIRTTTYQEWDAAIEASLYRWSARGEAIDKAKPHVTIEWDYLLNDLFDEDE